MIDLNHTFVTSDHHFLDWKNCPLHEGSEEEEARHIALWNSVVGKDDLVLYVGDFYESVPVTCKGGVADLQDLLGKLNKQGSTRDLSGYFSEEDEGAGGGTLKEL